MKAVGNWNKISPELQALIPRLKQGESVTFKMLNGITNQDPDLLERQRNPTIFPKSNIMLKDRIWDKFVKNEEGKVVGDWVDIVVADGWEKNEPTRMHLYFPYKHGTQFTGKFSFTGGNAIQEQIYEHIMLCNLNRDAVTGENRDKSVTPLFGQVSIAADRKNSTNKRDILLEALGYSKELAKDIPKAKSFGRSLNWNEYADDNELLMKIDDLAREKPEEFLKHYKDPSTEVKALIKEALASGVASFDAASGIFKLGEQVVNTVATKDRNDFTTAMATFFVEAPNGKSVLENMKKQVTEHKEPVMA